jgi:predicted nucleic acid-binding Zn ribbon protein
MTELKGRIFSAMFCQQCGKLLPERSRACEHCGYNHESPRISNNALLLAAIAALISGVGVVVSFLPRSYPSKAEGGPKPVIASEAEAPQATPAPKPTPYWKTENYRIKSHAVALNVGQMWSHPLDVEKDWRNARLVGRFKTQGGLRDDIYACVTDKDGLVNLKSGLAHTVWYESGRVTVDTINVSLPVGRSYFVLMNRYAWLTNRTVTFDLKVEYERLVNP